MPTEFYVPQNIVVHLGTPENTNAANVTVPFADYVKNVASSEIFPTWPENAIRANMYAQVSFALNRVFTEYYRARGYNFDITNTTQYDQAFVYGRDYFDNISRIADELFNDYVVRAGDIVPLFARYCNGTTSQCPGGMSQWGTVSLAEEGYTPYRILTSYYGDISIVENAPVSDMGESYPGRALRLGTIGDDVKRVQISLNRISKNYPAIPKIAYPDGVFDIITEAAVRKFQEIFGLTVDGVVGKATWYKIYYAYAGIKRLSELDSEGISGRVVDSQFKDTLSEGDVGSGVRTLQYFLSFIAEFNDFIPLINIDGIYGEATANAVSAFQQSVGLPRTGVVDEVTWNAIYSSYKTKYDSLPAEYRTSGIVPYPGDILFPGAEGEAVSEIQRYLRLISRDFDSIPEVEVTGYYGPETRDAVLAYEHEFGLPERGYVNYDVWNGITSLYSDLSQGEEKSFGQNPGYTLVEDTDYYPAVRG